MKVIVINSFDSIRNTKLTLTSYFNAANALELSFCFEFTTMLLGSHTSASELEIFVVDLCDQCVPPIWKLSI